MARCALIFKDRLTCCRIIRCIGAIAGKQGRAQDKPTGEGTHGTSPRTLYTLVPAITRRSRSQQKQRQQQQYGDKERDPPLYSPGESLPSLLVAFQLLVYGHHKSPYLTHRR